jgi:hypothetical protein
MRGKIFFKKMKMKLKSKIKTKTFRDFLLAIPKGFEEAHLEITQEGFNLDCIDNAHVLMSKICVGKETFDAYRLDGDFEIVFDVMRIKKFINTLQAPSITITISEDRNILLEANAMIYDLEVFNTLVAGSHSEIPELDFDDSVSLSTKDFKTYMEAAKKIGTETTLGLEKGEFIVVSQTQTDKVIVKISKDKMNALDGEHQIDLKSTFGTDYLLSISNATQILEYVELNLKNESVLKIGGGHDGIGVEYLLAPLRIK